MNFRERYQDMIDHSSYTHNLSSCEMNPWKKNSGLNEIQTYALCYTSAVLYQLSSYQAVKIKYETEKNINTKNVLWKEMGAHSNRIN